MWFRDLEQPGLRKALQKVGGVFVAATAFTPLRLAGDAVALFDIVTHMHGLRSFAEEAAEAVPVSWGGTIVNVLPLTRIIRQQGSVKPPQSSVRAGGVEGCRGRQPAANAKTPLTAQ